MKAKYKRSFLGYDPVGVDNLIKKMDGDYKNSLIQLRKQLADEVYQLELLKAEIRKEKNEVDSYKSLENEVSRLLYRSYMDAAEKAYSIVKNAEQMEKDAALRVMQKKAELSNLKASMEKVKKEVYAVVFQYMSVKEKAEGE